MSYRVSESALEFDKAFLAELTGAPVTNRNRLTVVGRALIRAMETDLTARQREILELIYFEKKTGKEAAQILGIHPTTVSHIKLRAEEKLRHSLRFYMDFLNCSLEE